MSESKKSIILTEDGSHSVFVPALNEHYHSVHGAMTESMHVFIDAGFHYVVPGRTTLNILEVGFGTGLNALLTFIYAAQADVSINYFAVEPYPLNNEMLGQLNYPVLQDVANAGAVFMSMHNAPFDVASAISEKFVMQKVSERFEVSVLPVSFFDLVYFDAFSPAVQPELWTREVFDIAAKAMKPGAVLVTYCCKGEVKRQLRAAGFDVKKIPGPPGKREMIRAIRF